MIEEIVQISYKHIKTSQRKAFRSTYQSLHYFNPIIIAFENYVYDKRRRTDFSFYFKFKDFHDLAYARLKRPPRFIREYALNILKSQIGHLAVQSPETLDGFWFERDSKSLIPRTLTYAKVLDSDLFLDYAMKKLIQPNLLKNNIMAQALNSSWNLCQIGTVTSYGLKIGSKLVFKMPIDHLGYLNPCLQSIKIVEDFRELFSISEVLLHLNFSFNTVWASIELITPKNERFSAKEKWVKLLKYSFCSELSVEGYYNSNALDCKIIVSGINHIKFRLNAGKKSSAWNANVKIYSGVLVVG